MSKEINFESGWELEKIRKEKRKARDRLLKKAQNDFEKSEELKKKQLESILPEIQKRVEQEAREIEAVKHKYKKEKKQKRKKSDKKHKKSKNNKKDDSDSKVEGEWVEKTVDPERAEDATSKSDAEPAPLKKIERQEWMVSDEFDNMFGQSNKNASRQEIRAKEEKELLSKAQSRELNPYWKDGGTGLPANQSEAPKGSQGSSGDGGLSWWSKALDRCKQMAVQQAVSVEEVAAERYGSLDELMQKIEVAQRFVDTKSASRFASSSKSCAFKKPAERGDDDDDDGGRRRRDGGDESERYRRDRPSSERWRDGGRRRGQDGGKSGGRDGWRRSGFEKRSNEDIKKIGSDKEDKERRRESECDKKKDMKRSDVRKDASSSSSPSSSSSSDESSLPSGNDYRVNNNNLNTTNKNKNIIDNNGNNNKSKQSGVGRKEVKVLTVEERNRLAARILKAEIMGNSQLAETLKKELNEADGGGRSGSVMERGGKRGVDDGGGGGKRELLMVMDNKGGARPFEGGNVDAGEGGGGRKRKKVSKVDSHEGGTRVRYFHDDDQHSLQELIRQEKTTTSQHDQLTFARLSGKRPANNVDDETLDDEWLQKQPTTSYIDSHSKQVAMIEQRRLGKKLDSCAYCFDNCLKHLVVSIGKKVYLALPSHRSMVQGHCVIAPLHHVTQSTVCDEDVLEEIVTYKRQLVSMFNEQEQDVIFLETCKNLKNHPHLSIHCIPMQRELADLAPIYFSKAINDSGGEWGRNRKLVKVKGTAIKQVIPAAFAYFYVSFGVASGYVHVIDDEATFPDYFGREVLGGMMELSPEMWRRPHKDPFEAQRSKALAFVETWKAFDHTLGVSS